MQKNHQVRVYPSNSGHFHRETLKWLSALAIVATALQTPGCAGLVTPATQTNATATLSANPGSVAFGDVELGTSSTQTLSFSNTGNKTLTVSQVSVSGAGFAVSGSTMPVTIAAGQSSSVSLQFAPTAASDASGTLMVASNAANSPVQVALSGRGVLRQLLAMPSSISFGSVAIGATNSQTVTLSNSGTVSLSISQGTISGAGFSFSGTTFPVNLTPGQSASGTVRFAPTTAGSATGSLSIASDAPNSPTLISLSGTGTQSQPQLTLSSNTLAFGNVNVGATASQTVSLSNTGSAALTISQVTVSGAGFVVTGLTTPQTINAGSAVSFIVQFAPVSSGAVTGSVAISSNSPGSPATIGLSGTGVQGQLTASPSSFNFGNILVGSSSSQTIILTNSGSSTVTISQATASGSGFGISGLAVPATINAGQSLSFTSTFAPTAAGNSSGSILITSNAPGSPLSIPLSGNGTQPQLSASPSSAAFGNVVTGMSNSQTITLTNGGTANTTISQATASGAGLSFSGLTVPVTITPGKTASFNAVFSPTSTGSVTGSISLVSNAPTSPLSISLSGTGVAPTQLLGASPTSVNLGNVNLGASGSSNVTLTNNGNSNVTVSSATVTGPGFSISGVGAGTVLAPNQSATLNITFAPTVAGSAAGTVTVSSNATNSPTVVAVSGTGVQPASAAFPVWVSPSMVRVSKTAAAGTTSSIVLSSARGETVDTQIVVQGPTSGLTNVNLGASALSGPGGASIAASNITLYREYYIAVTGTASYGGGNNPPQGSGSYPEPLIPFNDPETGAALCGSGASLKACNASVSAGQDQPYWIDISVPHGATNVPPGVYSGTVTVTADQGSVSVPVSVTVWNFELPVQPSELSLWTLWPPASGNSTATLARALMRNKIMAWYDVAANASGDISNFGLNRSGLDGYYFIGIQCNGSFSSIPSTSQINSAAANFPAGLGLDFYLADELNGCSSAYSPLKTMGTNAHAANRTVKTMMTTNAPDPNLYNEGDGKSAIDHWVLLDSVQQWPALPFTGGGDLWSYTSCNTGFGNTPEWLVDYPPINERIQAGFLNWTQGATGILYYRADGWTAGNAIGSWNNVDTTACGSGLGRPGDGIFLYPPAPIASTESAPGIRLKAIRDGIQDYEYAQILKNLGQASFLNPVITPIATSWTNWTHDPNALENARLQLGQKLSLLAP